MPEASQTFCTSFLSLRQYLGEQHGAAAWKRVRDTLAAERGVELPAVIAPGTWLPTQHFVTALHVAHGLFGPDDFYLRFGRAAAEYEVKWVHRVVLRFTSPLWVLDRAGDVWKKAHTTGHWRIESDRAHHLRGSLYGFGVVDRAYCDSLLGWLQRALVMTGADKLDMAETRCRARDGADACVYEGTW